MATLTTKGDTMSQQKMLVIGLITASYLGCAEPNLAGTPVESLSESTADTVGDADLRGSTGTDAGTVTRSDSKPSPGEDSAAADASAVSDGEMDGEMEDSEEVPLSDSEAEEEDILEEEEDILEEDPADTARGREADGEEREALDGGSETKECEEVGLVEPLGDFGPGTTELTVIYDNQGVESTRVVHLLWPEQGAVGVKYPLFFGFHKESNMLTPGANMRDQFMGAPIVGVFPDGSKLEDSWVGWNATGDPGGEDDVAFVRALWAALKAHPIVAKDHVYAFGHSLGSAFVGNALAPNPCTGFIRGIGLFSFPFLETTSLESTDPKRGVVIAHGASDQFISIYGGSIVPPWSSETLSFESAEETFQKWAIHNECGLAPEILYAEDYDEWKMQGCADGLPVVYYKLLQSNHTLDFSWYVNGVGVSHELALLYTIFVDGAYP